MDYRAREERAAREMTDTAVSSQGRHPRSGRSGRWRGDPRHPTDFAWSAANDPTGYARDVPHEFCMGTVLDLQNPWVLGRWVCEQRWRLRGDDQGLRLWWQWPGIN